MERKWEESSDTFGHKLSPHLNYRAIQRASDSFLDRFLYAEIELKAVETMKR